jgi:hypothetical protein
MDKVKSALIVACSVTMTAPALAQHDHPTLVPTICNKSGNYPGDGATSRILNQHNAFHFVLDLRKTSNSCTDGHDGVAMGGRVNCSGFPVGFFECNVSSFPIGEPTFSIMVHEPGVGNVVLEDVPFTATATANGFHVHSNLGKLNLPQGTTFQQIFVWDDDGPIDVKITDFSVDNIAVIPNTHNPLALDCTGITPADCLSV